MPLGIFKIGNVAAANAAQLPMIAAMFSVFFFISLYVQTVLGFSPVNTGLSFLPIPIVIGIISSQMPKVIHKYGYKWPMVTGPLFVSLALFLLSNITVNGNYWTDVLPGLILMGIGMGQVFISVTIAATAGVPAKESGLASGILNTSQQIGGALGLAILSGIAAAGAKSFIEGNQAITSGADKAQQLVFSAQVNGFQDALFVAAFFPLITSAVALFFIRHYQTDDSTAAIHV